jgi:RNA polymerase sigma factor (sigma-70 family)
MGPSADALISQAVAGDRECLAALLERFGPDVRRGLKIARKWSSVLDPDDVMQVTYLEAFLRIKQFAANGPESFLAWLRCIARNNLRDAVEELGRDKRPQPERRVRARPNARELDASSQQLFLELAGHTSTTPSRHAGRAEARSHLENAMTKLPATYRRVVHEFDLEGRPAAEVAAALGRTKAAVYMIRARAHDRLREILGSGSKYLSGASRRR